jgi:hypothetical protein
MKLATIAPMSQAGTPQGTSVTVSTVMSSS